VGAQTGVCNAIVAPQLFEQRRLTITQEPFLSIQGKVQNTRGTTMVQARRIGSLPYHSLGTPGFR
jgi:hypothetical protein